MAFGKIKVDTISYTDTNSVEQDASVETLVDNANQISTNTTNIASNTTAIAAKAPLASPQFTGIPVAKGDGSSTDGQIQLNCSQNSHGVKIKSPPHSANATYTLTLPNTTGSSGEFLQTNGSGVLSWQGVDVSGKADLASPTFTGQPMAPTAPSGTNTTQIATTAFVTAAVPDISGKADTADIGTTIQAYDADTAKTDVAQNFTAPQRLAVVTLTSAASITIDFTTGNNFILTTGHSAIAFANPTTEVAGQSGSIFIVQGSTTCAAPTWGDQYLFAGGTAPALTGTTGVISRIDYIVQEAGKIHCVTTDNLTAT